MRDMGFAEVVERMERDGVWSLVERTEPAPLIVEDGVGAPIACGPGGYREAMSLDELIARFDLSDPAFLADPYPVLDELREATPSSATR